MPIRLPHEPSPAQYEDCLVASVRALGYFTESQVVLKHATKEVLELDVVATPSDRSFGDRILFEAKRGQWGFPDLFKLYGQRMYLGINEARLVHLKAADAPAYGAIGGRISVLPKLYATPPAGILDLADSCVEMNEQDRGNVFSVGWYVQIALRIALADFNRKCQEQRDSNEFQNAHRYYHATRNSFFERDPLDRATALYRAYQATPGITGDLMRSTASLRTLENTSDHLWLQYMMLLEHRARFAVIKNAIDHSLRPPSAPGATLRFLPERARELMMPNNFIRGLEGLRAHPMALRMPLLLQVFVEVFGGFLFVADAEDVALLGRVTGIPADQVVACLNMLDVFFPMPEGGSWFYTQARNDNMMRLKWVPALALGGGCFFRSQAFSLENYGSRFTGAAWLMNQWHNALYRILENELAVPE